MRSYSPLLLLFLFLFVAEGTAQTVPPSTSASDATIKDPAIAKMNARLCPGCGHFYTGETLKGAALLTVGGVALIAAPFSLRAEEDVNCYDTAYGYGCDTGAKMNWTPFIALLGVAAASYVYGIIDAGPSANRANAKNGIQVSAAFRVEPMVTQSHNVTRVGFRLLLPR